MMVSYDRVSGVDKIAVLRANALGDFVFAQPALHALRAAYPLAEIVLLGKEWHADYLAGRPGPVNRVAIIPPYKGVSRPDTWAGPDIEEQDQIEAFFRRMRAERFDLALQMHGGGGNSNPFVQRLGARLTAGMRAPGAPALDRWMPYLYWQHEVLRLVEVAGLVGAPPVMLEPRIEVTRRDLDDSCAVYPDPLRPFIVLHPGASDPRRRWPAEKYAAAGDALARAGYLVVLVGIHSEANTLQAVQASMREPAANLCGALSLQGLTGLLARAALVIANDSGPRHLAEAVGTPTVGIYWCGNVVNAGSAFRTFHRPHLSWRLDCPVCGRNTLTDPCQHEVSFADLVSVDEVVDSALDVLRIAEDRQAQGQP